MYYGSHLCKCWWLSIWLYNVSILHACHIQKRMHYKYSIIKVYWGYIFSSDLVLIGDIWQWFCHKTLPNFAPFIKLTLRRHSTTTRSRTTRPAFWKFVHLNCFLLYWFQKFYQCVYDSWKDCSLDNVIRFPSLLCSSDAFNHS